MAGKDKRLQKLEKRTKELESRLDKLEKSLKKRKKRCHKQKGLDASGETHHPKTSKSPAHSKCDRGGHGGKTAGTSQKTRTRGTARRSGKPAATPARKAAAAAEKSETPTSTDTDAGA